MCDREQSQGCWVDIKTANLAEMKSFYARLLGWSFREEAWLQRTYTKIATSGGEIGGLTDLRTSPLFPPETKPHVSVYFAVDHICSTVEKVQKAGGEVLIEPFELGEQGTMATVQDNAGAVLSVWEPKQFRGIQASPDTVGTPSWFELLTPESHQSCSFYSAVFGWRMKEAEAGEELSHYVYAGSRLLGGMSEPTGHDELPHWRVGYKVDDLEGSLQLAGQPSGSAHIRKLAAGSTAVFCDPDGIPGYLIVYRY